MPATSWAHILLFQVRRESPVAGTAPRLVCRQGLPSWKKDLLLFFHWSDITFNTTLIIRTLRMADTVTLVRLNNELLFFDFRVAAYSEPSTVPYSYESLLFVGDE